MYFSNPNGFDFIGRVNCPDHHLNCTFQITQKKFTRVDLRLAWTFPLKKADTSVNNL